MTYHHSSMKNILTLLLLWIAVGINAQETPPKEIDYVTKEEVVEQFKKQLDMIEPNDVNESMVETFLKNYTDRGKVIIKKSDLILLNENTKDSLLKEGQKKADIEMAQLVKDKKNETSSIEESSPTPTKTHHIPSVWIWIAAAGLLIIMMLFVRRKKGTTLKSPKTPQTLSNDGNANIVVRRKTTSILRKQSLEDVIDNDNYLKIDCEEFCEDSAVRRIYLKNTCIKDIYNMYAEDLRNPDNPKEDGCMVLGRWVYDQESDEYYVSLEHIILPGDDAVFAEYELNFGGKIQIKKRERLNKLRQETNLQYDLTCWVHSHPGLGVFFSNNDSSVQMLLKNNNHPRFLTAIVIDILTPKQELGIFTFKKDYNLNSKDDLKKMYSLEDLYQWAVESDRNSFKPEDHYNALMGSKKRMEECYGIELSNGAIIDIGMLAAEQREGFVGTVHGFVSSKENKTEFVAVKVTTTESVPDNEPVGCFFIASHCSIPSIRKALDKQISKVGFVMVYTTSDGLLTSIPTLNKDLCTDQNYYGEQLLEDLKIWTRRKR